MRLGHEQEQKPRPAALLLALRIPLPRHDPQASARRMPVDVGAKPLHRAAPSKLTQRADDLPRLASSHLGKLIPTKRRSKLIDLPLEQRKHLLDHSRVFHGQFTDVAIEHGFGWTAWSPRYFPCREPPDRPLEGTLFLWAGVSPRTRRPTMGLRPKPRGGRPPLVRGRGLVQSPNLPAVVLVCFHARS